MKKECKKEKKGERSCREKTYTAEVARRVVDIEVKKEGKLAEAEWNVISLY